MLYKILRECKKDVNAFIYYTNRIDCIKNPKFYQSSWKAKLRRWYGRQNFLPQSFIHSCTNVGGRNKPVVGFPDKEFIDKNIPDYFYGSQDDRVKE